MVILGVGIGGYDSLNWEDEPVEVFLNIKDCSTFKFKELKITIKIEDL